ncbi:MAG: LysM peptidoglycan-binding domain-containing protein [Desulfobacteraceae bacterium]|nr:LysM peptidoglycan-binding domain-containing protein [Desulfobacteraceae bacterium]
MQKTFNTLTLVLLISFFITSPNVFGNDTGSLKSFFNENTGFYYTVQKGDTLWDLSQKFYSSEWDWPGLWELNDRIKNPHIIYPGERLRVFFKGGLSLENRPIYVEPKKTEKPIEVEPVEKPEEVKVEKIVPPKPEIKLSFNYPFIDSVGFIKKAAISSAGKVLRSEDDSDLISQDDIIYVKASKNDSLIPGKSYQVYVAKKIAKNKIRHSIKGIIQISENKMDYFTAKVIETFIDINPGDLIMDFLERDKEFEVSEDNAKINAKIICNDLDDSMFGERQFVYMDLGKNDGIETGQVYTIYKALEEKEKVALNPLKTGKIIVLHTEDISSTILIFLTSSSIHVGDLVH